MYPHGPFLPPLSISPRNVYTTNTLLSSEARASAFAQQRRVPCAAREQGKQHGGDERGCISSSPDGLRQNWLAPKRRRSRVDVTKQGCLVRKAGQRTVRLTVAPGSWIVPTHLLFLLLFLRNTLIENPLDPFDHVFDAWCLLRAWGKT